MKAEDRKPISNHKTLCRAIAPDGWQYSGFDDGYYIFKTGNYTDGFREMRALDKDLTVGNLALMAHFRITR